MEKRLFTAGEYHKMAEAGILKADEKVELIRGEILKKGPVSNAHMACVRRFNRKFSTFDSCILSIKHPVSIDTFSEPEPDLALLKYRKDFYQNQKPKPGDVLLLIEVSDSTLEKDQKVKIPLYAGAGIPEAWLVDLQENKIIVYLEPAGKTYRQFRQYFSGEIVTCGTIKNLEIAVSDVIWIE